MAEFYSASGWPKSRRFRGLLLHRRSQPRNIYPKISNANGNVTPRNSRIGHNAEKQFQADNCLFEIVELTESVSKDQFGRLFSWLKNILLRFLCSKLSNSVDRDRNSLIVQPVAHFFDHAVNLR